MCCRPRSEEHTSELQSHVNLVCRLLLEKKKQSEYRCGPGSWPIPNSNGAQSCCIPSNCCANPRDLHSFPTRRSSDLERPFERFVIRDFEHGTGEPREERRVKLVGADIHHVRAGAPCVAGRDRKSTRLNSSHMSISYAVFCLKKKNKASTAAAPAAGPSRTATARRAVAFLLTAAPTPAIYTLSLHDALPISSDRSSASSYVTSSTAPANRERNAASSWLAPTYIMSAPVPHVLPAEIGRAHV